MEKLPTPPLIKCLYAYHYAHIIASKRLIVWDKNQSSDSSSDSHIKKNLKTHYESQKVVRMEQMWATRSPRLCTRRRQWQPHSILLPGKSHGQRSLVVCSPWGREDSDMTERLHFYFSLSCTGDGNGNPLQCSCLENPRDGGAWWALVSGVAQSWTRLKRLSSSSRLCTKKYTPNKPWIFTRKTDVEAEAPILGLPDSKNWLIRKDPDAGKDWRQKGRGQQRMR